MEQDSRGVIRSSLIAQLGLQNLAIAEVRFSFTFLFFLLLSQSLGNVEDSAP